MLEALKKLLRPQPERRSAAIPAGQRVYAVGDIHGRCDLFTALVAAIDADDAAQQPAETTVVLLGDLVDRGPDSAGVIAAARAWGRRRTLRYIAGNHEEMFLESFHNPDFLRLFLKHGGCETLLSYPLCAEAFRAAAFDEVPGLMAGSIPDEDTAFLAAFEDMVTIGDYLFVHAGIMPGVPLDEQKTGNLRWIREPFLGYPGDHGLVVVHGHTITEEVEIKPNRIGIDTGAYFSGRLTALALEGTTRRLIEARDTAGDISIHTRSIS
ncbi:MAG TPA: metallophosphoesterase [Novosphingobium sp.]|nr:metallophosphoesterase [Novosphingobium sp.]